MTFNLEKLFMDIFSPLEGETITVMMDYPHDHIPDNPLWEDRRKLTQEWYEEIKKFAPQHGLVLLPLVTYPATGANNGDLPEEMFFNDNKVSLKEVFTMSSIILNMVEFSATAPLRLNAEQYAFRAASMPGIARQMQETALSADYQQIAKTCQKLAPYFQKATGAQAKFSTGHECYFDLSNNSKVFEGHGLMPPESVFAVNNLPTGEVFTVPNEDSDSETNGELPVSYGKDILVYKVKHNTIVDVQGTEPLATQEREKFKKEPARCNIAEFAIGCNDKAKVTGIVLEDEKAGFHFAFGRSDHFGGKVGVKDFSAPEQVIHHDVVYAKESPVTIAQLDFIFPDHTRHTVLKMGEIII